MSVDHFFANRSFCQICLKRTEDVTIELKASCDSVPQKSLRPAKIFSSPSRNSLGIQKKRTTDYTDGTDENEYLFISAIRAIRGPFCSSRFNIVKPIGFHFRRLGSGRRPGWVFRVFRGSPSVVADENLRGTTRIQTLVVHDGRLSLSMPSVPIRGPLRSRPWFTRYPWPKIGLTVPAQPAKSLKSTGVGCRI